jgi:signal peptidase II
MKHQRLFWFLFITMLILDQVVKLWTRNAAGDVEGRTFLSLWPNVLDLTLTFNEGVAFGMFQGKAIFLTPVAVGIAGGAAYYSYKHAKETLWVHAGMSLVASGALGNLYDRLIHGRVTDMFHLRFVNFPVFNVADACITVGAAMLIVVWGIESMHHKAKPANEPEIVQLDANEPKDLTSESA